VSRRNALRPLCRGVLLVPESHGRQLDEKLGKVHFWLSFVAINFVFMPMFFQGMAGLSRRLYDPTVYAHGRGVAGAERAHLLGRLGLGLSQLSSS